jgi:CubicO group peptidase (beta-lactamase class C family)
MIFGQSKGASNQFDKDKKLSTEQSELIYRTLKNVPEETVIAMALINGDRIEYVGIKRLNDSLYKLDLRKEAFEIGSLTKNITSLLLAEMVVAQRVDLNENIATIFDFKLKTKEIITLNHLASHLSGLPRLPDNMKDLYSNNPYKNYSRTDLKDYLTENLVINQPPGQKWDYSNLGFGVLGYALEQKSNESLQNLYNKYIFNKIKLENTQLDRSFLKVNQVKSLDIKGKPTSNWDFDVMAAAGGLKSTIEDMVKLTKIHFDKENPVVKMVFKERYQMNENVSSTLSWLYAKDKKVFINNGGTGGFSSSWSIQPDQKKAVIILTNVSGLGMFSEPLQTLNLQLLNSLNHDSTDN